MKNQYSPIQLAWNRFVKIKSAVFAMCFILFWIIVSFFASFLIPDSTENANSQFPEIAGLSCCTKVYFIQNDLVYYPIENRKEFWYLWGTDTQVSIHKKVSRFFILGTDRFGRDVFSRLVLGSRYSLAVGFVSVLISLLVGVSVGSLAGYYRGKLDSLLSWLVTVIWSIPLMLLVIAITLALGKGLLPLFLAIGLATWVDVARVVRGQILSLREKEFIEACRAFGFSNGRIISRHIIPNLSGILLVLASSNFASAILLESGLNFLGLGAQAPVPTWGNMIRDHIGYLFSGNQMAFFAPCACVFLIVLAFSSVGNALRDAMDVKYLEKS